MGLDAEMQRCRKWIEAALEYSGGTHDYQDIVESVKTGAMQFWPAEDACAITEIIVYPRKRAFHVFLAGGNMDTIVDMDESAVYYAKINGCTIMSIAGRKGWQRVLNEKGYKPYLTSLAKEI